MNSLRNVITHIKGRSILNLIDLYLQLQWREHVTFPNVWAILYMGTGLYTVGNNNILKEMEGGPQLEYMKTKDFPTMTINGKNKKSVHRLNHKL